MCDRFVYFEIVFVQFKIYDFVKIERTVGIFPHQIDVEIAKYLDICDFTFRSPVSMQIKIKRNVVALHF